MIRALFRVLDAPHRALLRRMLVGLVAGAVLQGVAFALLVPLLTALFSPDPAGAWPWLGALAAVFALYAWAYCDSIMAGYRTGAGLSRALHHRLGDHVAQLPLGWFTAERTGQLAQLAGKGVTDIMGTPAHLLRPIVSALLTPLVVVALMAVFDWRLALAAIVMIPLAALTYRLTGRLVGGAEAAHDAAATEAAGRVLDPATLPTWSAVPAAAAGQVVKAPKELNNVPAYDGLIDILEYLEPILAAADPTVSEAGA